ncbi:MAG: arsenite methyltransferase [Dehalococcoidia bacterium]|nr:arsenite methyltransferase [Dehalococcoidia bacterium]
MAESSSTAKTNHAPEEIKKLVQETYAAAVAQRGGCCGQSSGCGTGAVRTDIVQPGRYSPEELAALPAGAVQNSFGCGNPLAFAGVSPGATVLDIGSGAGIDVLLASRIVGPAGRVIGLDFTPEMIERARRNAASAGVSNVEFRQGDAEQMPVEDGTVDWIISNCVINLAPDKRKVFSEVFRVLKPGGRVSISDIVTSNLPEDIRGEIGLWSSCIAGAIDETEYLRIMRDSGLVDVEVTSRRYYDEASVQGLLDEVVTAASELRRARVVLLQRADLARAIWSAKIVGRKPE